MLPKIYPITDCRISGISLAEQVRLLAEGGARIVQIREKQIASQEWYDDAVEAVHIAHKAGVKVIINDRADLAMTLGADGVHLGRDDMPPVEARKLLGVDATIGFSTHTIEQARAAVGLPVDYIAFGPVFPTDTKTDTEPVVGLEMLARVKSEIGDMPLVAIGGINASNLASVFDAGADSAAMIGAILSDPTRITSRMLEFSSIHV